MLTNRLELSKFSYEKGLELPDESRALTYLYGLSDFWMYMFEDESLLSSLLGVQAVSLAELYNLFLQQAGNISLNTVQEHFGYQIRLELLTVTSATQNVFPLPEQLRSARTLCNTPVFPSVLLEENVDYVIDVETNTITFAQPLSTYNFPVKTSDGVTYYAIWAVDAKVDTGALKDYALLVGQNITNPTLTYKAFLQGVYYLYINGPTLDLIVQGLNLSLGIPLASAAEEVLATVQDPVTNNWTVVSSSNSYELPYGLPPSVTVGQTLAVFDTLSNWIQVEDEKSQDGWWINLQIPTNLIKTLPPGESSYAIAGSYADWVMRHYLARHTFLVNINTTNFENIQQFSSVIDLLLTVKPKYTTQIYIWSVPVIETLTATATEAQNMNWGVCENLATDITNFRRDSLSPLTRGGCAHLTRFSYPGKYTNAFAAVQTSSSNVTNAVPALNYNYDNQGIVTRVNLPGANAPAVEKLIVGLGGGTSLTTAIPSNVSSPLTVFQDGWAGEQLLHSQSRTNLNVYSTSLTDPSWVANSARATAASSTVTDPSGGTNASVVTTTASNNDVFWANASQAITQTPCFSVYFKSGGTSPSDFVTLRTILYSYGTTVVTDVFLQYQFSTGVISGTTASYSSYGVIYVGNGWYRFWCVPVPIPGLSFAQLRFRAGTLPTVSGETALFFGPQIEVDLGTGPGLYIPTYASPVSYTDYAVVGNNLTVTYVQAHAAVKVDTLVNSATPRQTWNYVYSSSNLSTGFINLNNSATFNAGIAPDGTQTAAHIVTPAGLSSWSSSLVQQLANFFPLGKTYTYSAFYKAGQTSQITHMFATVFDYDYRVYVDLNLGVILGTNATENVGISYVGEGWYRVWITFLFTDFQNGYPASQFFLGNTYPYLGSNAPSADFFAWGPQLEEGPVPTAYNPTTPSSYAPSLTAPGLMATFAATAFNRGGGQFLNSRSTMSWTREVLSNPVTNNTLPLVAGGNRAVYLYTVSSWALSLKLAQLGGLKLPPASTWFFTLVDGSYPNTMEINEYAINSSNGSTGGLGLYLNNFELLFEPAPGESLPPVFGPPAYQSYTPNPSSLVQGDYLLFVQSTSEAWACYWVTSNFSTSEPGWPYAQVDSTDSLSLTTVGRPTRGGLTLSSAPFYATRGFGGSAGAVSPVAPLNTQPVNAQLPSETAVVTNIVNYRDYSNYNVPLTRELTLTENATF
jgi:hypothetical protein